MIKRHDVRRKNEKDKVTEVQYGRKYNKMNE